MTHLPLGSDPLTAYRLVMDPDGTAAVGEVIATWSVLTDGPRRNLADLPEGMTREGDRLTIDVTPEPIVLTTDEVIAEAFRLSAMHAAPGEKGWHLHSNVVRAGKLLGKHTTMLSSVGDPTTFASFVRNAPTVEGLVDRRDVLFVRPRPVAMDIVDGKPNRVVAKTLCAFDAAPRDFGEFDTFTEARQAVLRCPTGLVTHRTTIEMTRGDECLKVFFDAPGRRWRIVDGGFMKAIHPGEKPRFPYRNGHLVGGLVGYVTINRRGLIHATVGTPYDSDGDEDASVALVNRREAADVSEALDMLRQRGDVDHIFTEPVSVGSMGVWLTCLTDATGDAA